MATLVEHGRDTSGPKAKRPARAENGFCYYCTDTKELLVYDEATRSWRLVGSTTPYMSSSSSSSVSSA